jgi:hypothetical protein
MSAPTKSVRPSRGVYRVSNLVRDGKIEIATEEPSYQRIDYMHDAPLDRAYSLAELKLLGQRGGKTTKNQANSARLYFHHSIRLVEDEIEHIEGIQIFYSTPVVEDGVTLRGRPCRNDEVVVVDIEEMRQLLAPANMLYRQPLPFIANQYTTYTDPTTREEKAIGFGQTFVVRDFSPTNLLTGEVVNLGTLRFYTMMHMFRVLGSSQLTLDDGSMSVPMRVYQKYFGETGMHTVADVDWFNAHVEAVRRDGDRSIRTILKLSRPHRSKDGKWEAGYSDDEVTLFFNDLEAFNAHRQKMTQIWWENAQSVEPMVTEPEF